MDLIMKLLTTLILSVVFTGAYACATAQETKEVTVGKKTYEVRVPKSAKTNCKLESNKDKTECKKQPAAMPKIEKPVEDLNTK